MSDDKALAWVQALRARGVTLAVVNGRLRLSPESAYREQSDDELLTLRHCRDAIKALVKSGAPVPAPQAATPAPQAPQPVPVCDYCGRPCIGVQHVWYHVLHFNDPAEVAKRDKVATAEMMRGTR